MLNPNSFSSDATAFLERLFSELAALHVEFPKHWHIDHLCYRASTDHSYLAHKEQLSTFASLITETPVNGRLISTFNLETPIEFQSHIIRTLELPQPKIGSQYADGFEHIEIVCDKPLDELPKLYPTLTWAEHQATKTYNDEIKCQLVSGALKFHHQTLDSVVTLEKNTRAFSALLDSKVLDDLKLYQPLVVGTFPLGLETPNSDIDIVLSHPQLSGLQTTITKYYSHLKGFRLQTSCVLSADTLSAQFEWYDVPFELFAQKTPSFLQNGYRHFAIEERLLKVHGQKLRLKVLELRKQGLKTEPAFGKALRLEGDPYTELLKLSALTDFELKKLF